MVVMVVDCALSRMHLVICMMCIVEVAIGVAVVDCASVDKLASLV